MEKRRGYEGYTLGNRNNVIELKYYIYSCFAKRFLETVNKDILNVRTASLNGSNTRLIIYKLVL